MSYARFGWDGSDVYVFANMDGLFECMCCALQPSPRPENLIGYDSHYEPTAELMVEHLLAHRSAGHVVPNDAISELRAEAGT